jgi:hypothetical protein
VTTDAQCIEMAALIQRAVWEMMAMHCLVKLRMRWFREKGGMGL